MPKVSVYLPQKMHRRAVEAGLPISRLCQLAISEALGDETTTAEAIERVIAELEAIAEAARTRVVLGIDQIRAAGLDPSTVFGDIPWLADYGVRGNGKPHPREREREREREVEGNATGGTDEAAEP